MGDLSEYEIDRAKPNLTRKPNFAVIKRKSLGTEATKSLDISSDQMKKSKLLKDYNSKYDTYIRLKEPRTSFDRSRQSLPSKVMVNENSSLVSTDFSHYELLRNLSACRCYSCVSHSGTTCNCASDSEAMSKREHLEKYFQSAEKWNKDAKCYDTTNDHF